MANKNPKNECKLMVLYLLNSVSIPLNHENLSNFFLDKYTTYITFQEILSELVDTKLIEEEQLKTSITYKATNDGIEALNSFINDISEQHRKELDDYIKENKIKIKEESIIRANYTDGKNGNFSITLEIHDTKDENLKITYDVPSSDVATTMCENWSNKAKQIYAYIIKELL